MAWFKTGTINVTNNSDIVTGNNAGFNNSIKRGLTSMIRSATPGLRGLHCLWRTPILRAQLLFTKIAYGWLAGTVPLKGVRKVSVLMW